MGCLESKDAYAGPMDLEFPVGEFPPGERISTSHNMPVKVDVQQPAAEAKLVEPECSNEDAQTAPGSSSSSTCGDDHDGEEPTLNLVSLTTTPADYDAETEFSSGATPTAVSNKGKGKKKNGKGGKKSKSGKNTPRNDQGGQAGADEGAKQGKNKSGKGKGKKSKGKGAKGKGKY
eukprot:g7403.t1